MALTVSGSSADSYISLADADTYAAEHFIGSDLTSWNASNDDEKEAALREAALFIDNQFRNRFPGVIRSESQALEWPRTNAHDRSGRHISDIPQAVKDAQVELAKEKIVAGGSLMPTEARGGRVKSKTAGPVSVTYEDGAPAGRNYPHAQNLLSQVLRPGSNIRGLRRA